jgi:hypothetical protein
MRIAFFYVVASLFALGFVACGGQVSNNGNAASGGHYPGTGGTWAVQSGTGGAINITTPTATGGTEPAYSVVVTGGAGGYLTASAGTAGYIGATGGATYADGVLVNGFDSASYVRDFMANSRQLNDCSVNAMAENDAGAAASIDWSETYDSHPNAVNRGSMMISVTFTGWNQYADVYMYAPTDPYGNHSDLTNKLVTAQVWINTGLSPNASYPYLAAVYVKTGNYYVWGASPWTYISSPSSWNILTLDTTNPQGVPEAQTWDPTHPSVFGIKLGTGGGGETSECQGDYVTSFGPPQTTVFYVDDIRVTPRP